MKYYTTRHMGKALGILSATVSQYCKQGILKFTKQDMPSRRYMFSKEDLDANVNRPRKRKRSKAHRSVTPKANGAHANTQPSVRSHIIKEITLTEDRLRSLQQALRITESVGGNV